MRAWQLYLPRLKLDKLVDKKDRSKLIDKPACISCKYWNLYLTVTPWDDNDNNFPQCSKARVVYFHLFSGPLRAPCGKLPKTNMYAEKKRAQADRLGEGGEKFRDGTMTAVPPEAYIWPNLATCVFNTHTHACARTHTHTPIQSSQNYLLLQPT